MNSKRYNALISLLLTIIISVGLMACSSQPKLPHLADDAVIVAFGDSLTFGTGAEPMQSNHDLWKVAHESSDWKKVKRAVMTETLSC